MMSVWITSLHRNGIKVYREDTAVGLPSEGVVLTINSQLRRFNFLPACELDTWSPRSDFANSVRIRNKSARDIRNPVDDIVGNDLSRGTSRGRGPSPSTD